MAGQGPGWRGLRRFQTPEGCHKASDRPLEPLNVRAAITAPQSRIKGAQVRNPQTSADANPWSRPLSNLSIIRRFEWDSAHRIAGHEGACKALHGHRYVAEIEITAPAIDQLGRVIDFGVFKSVVGDWILANFDHSAIFDRADTDPGVAAVIDLNARMGKPAYLLDGPPTAERLVVELADALGPLLATLDLGLSRIRLWETPNCSALWSAAEG